ncbi:HNH endonuclease [Herbaspirillum huttiense]|uniref:HNH endonuclease n=1 Tax=Herbaspirillum huttiense TaxID=863372 RepID=UPI0021769789|nr:HNH endonuclease [Herbaspirillum huttiense]UWE16090.1 HNH endonuclease [Herbaspirillum huttiense]
MTSQVPPDDTTAIPTEPTIGQQIGWIYERYDIIAKARFGQGALEEEVLLGANEPQICRYCGKSVPNVSFDQKAHAMPGLIGNQWLFDLLECDQCNALFGATIDAHFGRWSASWRALERTPNREGTSPKYSTRDGTIHIESDDSNRMTIVQGVSEAGRYTIDPETRIVDFKLTRRGFAPSGVFKCLVKMAISVAPPEVSESLKHLKAWIRGDAESSETFAEVLLVLFIQTRPTIYAPGRFDFQLLRRKPEASTDSPYMFFRLRFGGRAYQIALPLLVEDTGQPKDKIPRLPMLPGDIEAISDLNQPAEPVKLENMSSSEIEGREDIVLRYGMGTLHELDPSQFNLLASGGGKQK